jgi:hypothetical protein
MVVSSFSVFTFKACTSALFVTNRARMFDSQRTSHDQAIPPQSKHLVKTKITIFLGPFQRKAKRTILVCGILNLDVVETGWLVTVQKDLRHDQLGFNEGFVSDNNEVVGGFGI